MRTFMKAHVWLYRRTSGRWGSMGGTVVLLTTTGRRTGEPRTVPLMAIRDGDRYLVAASAGGNANNPGWYHNVAADPAVTLEDGGRTMSMQARVAGAEERSALWQRFVDEDERYAKYAARAEREIPVVIVEP